MSSEQPLHVVIKIPYKRPPGFVEPPSVVWTEEMEQKLWEILTQNKRQSIDWYAASRLLNVPVPYLLRHAAFLYETQLRGVQMQLRRGETLSASNSTGAIGSRNRASTLTRVDGDGTGHQRPPSAMSNASREQYVTSRGSQDMVRTGSNTSLTDGRKQTSGSASSSIHAQSINEVGLQFQAKNGLTHTQATPSPPPIWTTNISGRQVSPSSSVSTITTDHVMKQSTPTHKLNNYSTTLSTIESSTNESFATPAASVTMPLSRTLSNPLPHDIYKSITIQETNLDDESDEEDDEENDEESDEDNDSLKKSEEEFSLSKKLAELNLPAFLPISSDSETQTSAINANYSSENKESIDFRVPVIDLTTNLRPTNIRADSQQSLSANDSSSSFSDIGSLTQSELEALLDETSNFGSKTLSLSRKSTYSGTQ